MNDRENLLACMRRLPFERVPFQFSLCESQRRSLRQKYGTDDVVQLFGMPVQYIELPASTHPHDYSSYHANAAELSFIDEWGVGHKKGSVEHFTHMYPPMGSFTSASEVAAYPFPDMLEEKRWESVRRKNDEAHAKGLATAFFAVQVFEPAWYLRGLDNLLADMLLDEEMAHACLSKMVEIQSAIAAKAAACGVDIIVFGDDVGTQRALMMSLETWRAWIKPATQATIQAAKKANPEVLALYHSDGVIYDIIPELIDIGVDILNPVQPECMDAVELKRMYGKRLSFWGTIGTQTTMPFGTPQDVEEAVRQMILTVGQGGGLCIAPTHLLEPEVPFENIETFVKAVRKYGGYE